MQFKIGLLLIMEIQKEKNDRVVAWSTPLHLKAVRTKYAFV